MRIFALFTFLIISIQVISQNPNLYFSGSAYVDVGSNAMNGARTIELWFKLDSAFHESSTEAQTLIARNTTWCNSCDEIQLALVAPPLDPSHAGQLRFGWQGQIGGNPQKIFSDQNYWQPDIWYHVAGVIDPTHGMRLFVNGVLQSQTNASQTLAGTQSDTATYIGKWGNAQFNHRYFKGHIENVRISTTARYSANFTPDCANDTVDSATQAMWHFNSGTGFTAFDSTTNQYNGSIINAIWSSDTFCIQNDDPHGGVSAIDNDGNSNALRIFPNPTSERLVRLN